MNEVPRGWGCLCLDSEHDGPLCSLTYTVAGLVNSYIPVISKRVDFVDFIT